MNNDTAMRPTSFAAYVGQPALVERLRILVGAARARGEVMSHTLLHGPPGLGKTTLAHIVAAEMGTTATVIMGPSLEKAQDVQAALGRLKPGDILFVDEIHSACKAACEIFYSAMEDRRMIIMLDTGGSVRPIPINLPPFTLIGATTQPGLLEAPLRDRFGIPLALSYYSDADLFTILSTNAATLKLIYEPTALKLLASRSRGTPRIANHLLRFARDFASVRGDGVLSVEIAQAALTMQGIDSAGLNEQDRTYLRIIVDGRPVGANALAMTMGLKTDTIEGVIEPYLLREKLLSRTPRGRCITDKGRAHIENSISEMAFCA